MGKELIDQVDKAQNPYFRAWFKPNMRLPDEQSTTEKFVDTHFIQKDEETSIHIFFMGMMNEVNYFREARDEELFTSVEDISRRKMTDPV